MFFSILRQCFRNTFVTLFFFLFQISLRNDYLFFLSIDIAKKFIDCDSNICLIVIDVENFITNAINVKKKSKTKNLRKKKKYIRRKRKFWSRKYLQINMMKRSIFRTKQKQKHQNDIDFANVYCFKFVEFEFFVFLLIDAFWLIANIKI